MTTALSRHPRDPLRESLHREWAKVWIEAYIWWCGDDICNCTQPKLDRVSPNHHGIGYPWIRRMNLWSGTFVSDRDGDELAVQEGEINEIANRFGITLDRDYCGRRIYDAAFVA